MRRIVAIALVLAVGACDDATTTETEPTTTTSIEQTTTAPASSVVSYRSCDDVRAAGAAPIRQGDPGFSGRLDADGDGIACETE